MPLQQKLIQITASIIYLLKAHALKNANLKFLVFTGTAGKTTLRDTVAHSLRSLGKPVQSNTFGYSNELGIMISAIGLPSFSAKNISDWFIVLRKEIIPNQYVCIELGADFYSDIPWFLKRFTPYAVFISGIADTSWSRNLADISNERKNLLTAIPDSGYVFYNQDNLPSLDLITSVHLSATLVNFSLVPSSHAMVMLEHWSKNIYTKNITKAVAGNENISIQANNQNFDIHFNRPLFEPQVYAILAAIGFITDTIDTELTTTTVQEIFDSYQFSKNRLQFSKLKNGAILLEDSYKATPLCTFWFLNMAMKIKAKKKILIVTEMRPLTFTIELFYSELGKLTTLADTVYFVGPLAYYEILKKSNPKINHIRKEDYEIVAQEILTNTQSGDLVLLKGSQHYDLMSLRKQLI